jgi:hypothetical protein
MNIRLFKILCSEKITVMSASRMLNIYKIHFEPTKMFRNSRVIQCWRLFASCSNPSLKMSNRFESNRPTRFTVARQPLPYRPLSMRAMPACVPRAQGSVSPQHLPASIRKLLQERLRVGIRSMSPFRRVGASGFRDAKG